MPYDEKPPTKEDMGHFSTMKSGIIGETAVIHDLTINYPEYDVYRPIVDDKGVDILVDTGTTFRKVQVKTVNLGMGKKEYHWLLKELRIIRIRKETRSITT